MNNTKTLLKTIKKTRQQLDRQRNKFRYSVKVTDKDDAYNEILRLKTKILNLQNQIKFNHAMNPVSDKVRDETFKVISDAFDDDGELPW